MTGERLAWQDVAAGLMESFGDVARPATFHRRGQSTLDQSLGRYTFTFTDLATKILWAKKNRIYQPGLENWMETDRVAMVRGKDFSADPTTSDELTVDGIRYKIKNVMYDSAGTGAYFYLHVGA